MGQRQRTAKNGKGLVSAQVPVHDADSSPEVVRKLPGSKREHSFPPAQPRRTGANSIEQLSYMSALRFGFLMSMPKCTGNISFTDDGSQTLEELMP